MKDLIAIFAAAGCKNVSNYIQSGNIIFEASPALTRKLPALISAEVERQFGFPGRLVIRSLHQLREIAANNPYLAQGAAVELLSVMFLADLPDAAAISKLDPLRSHPDTYVVQGDAIFLHTITGAADTKLTNAYFDSKLKTFSTARNWRTVLKLCELMES